MLVLPALTRSAMKTTVTAFKSREALLFEVDTNTVIAAVIIVP